MKKPRNSPQWLRMLQLFYGAAVSTYEPLPRDDEAHKARAQAKRDRRIQRNRDHGWYGVMA